MLEKLQSEKEADAFLKSLSVGNKSLELEDLDSEFLEDISDEYILRKNSTIIQKVDNHIIERLELNDKTLSIKDMLGLKTEAFKQNQLIKGRDTGDNSLIPSTINIQIINN